jgi:hypothetical protein
MAGYVANTKVPSSGPISITALKAAYANRIYTNSMNAGGNGNNMNSYRGQGYVTASSVPFNSTTAPTRQYHGSGSISFSQMRNTVDWLQATPVANQQINMISDQYPIGGCAGAGVKGMNFRTDGSKNVAIYCGGAYADYSSVGSTNYDTSYGGTVTAWTGDSTSDYGPSPVGGTGKTFTLSGLSGSNHDATSNPGKSIYAYSRDNVVLTVRMLWNSDTGLGVQIIYNCKGGTWPNGNGYSLVTLWNSNTTLNMTFEETTG